MKFISRKYYKKLMFTVIVNEFLAAKIYLII